MFSIYLRKEAAVDLDEIFIWYEAQKENLGFEFIKVFQSAIEKLSHYPHYASFTFDDARSMSLKRFPYEVIYRIDEEKQQVRIIAIIHQHRNPDWFKKRIQNDK